MTTMALRHSIGRRWGILARVGLPWDFAKASIHMSPCRTSIPKTDSDALESAVQIHLDALQSHHDALVEKLARPHVPQEEMTAVTKEIAELSRVIQAKNEMDATRSEMSSVKELIEEDIEDWTDQQRELLDLAEEELQDLKNKYQSLLDSVVESLLPKDDVDSKGCVVEVRAGTGGEEACLFAKDLFSMYQRFCQFKGWTYDIVEQSQSELGGYKVAIATVSCPKYSEQPAPYALLKFESGVHRVQRVPATESGGRIHTSAASVTILPEADPLDIDIKDEDIRIDTYRSSGAGGQHVNTTNSAVRVTHIPSGTSVAIQDERSQHKNKAKALSVLRARILDAENQKAAASKSDARRQQIGTGDRSARVRTYNIPQGRVTDHRISYSIHGDLDTPFLLAGESLEEMLEKLQSRAKSMAVQDMFLSSPTKNNKPSR